MKNLIKNNLKELLNDDETMSKGLSDNELIYIIDDIDVYGGFDCGCRSHDHNCLIDDSITWEDLLLNGTVIVPETQSYISDDNIERLDVLGYERLPLNNNHIVGFK